MKRQIDQTDAKLLDILQKDFPLTPRPFDAIARRLGISPAEVMDRVSRLKSESVIRQISAIFDSAALGYRSALVAFKVAGESLDRVAGAVATHPGVSHCYERAAEYNLWFTITVGEGGDLEGEVRAFAELDGVQSHLILPALRVFKIGVFLKMTDGDAPAGAAQAQRRSSPAAFPPEDRDAVRALQRDLAITETPFAGPAREAGMSEDALLRAAARFLRNGVMRRFAAVLRHRRAGYRWNAMVCWRVPRERIEETGAAFAADPSVSHCYERPTSSDWPYPLYTMVHARSEEDLRATIAHLAAFASGCDYLVLESLKEYKKSRVSYF